MHILPFAIVKNDRSKYWLLEKDNANNPYCIVCYDDVARPINRMRRKKLDSILREFASLYEDNIRTATVVPVSEIPTETYKDGLFVYPIPISVDGRETRVFEQDGKYVVAAQHGDETVVLRPFSQKYSAIEYFRKLARDNGMILDDCSNAFAWWRMPPDELQRYAGAYIRQRLVCDSFGVKAADNGCFEVTLAFRSCMCKPLVLSETMPDLPEDIGGCDYAVIALFSNNVSPSLYYVRRELYADFRRKYEQNRQSDAAASFDDAYAHLITDGFEDYSYSPRKLMGSARHYGKSVTADPLSFLPNSRRFLLELGVSRRYRGFGLLAAALDIALQPSGESAAPITSDTVLSTLAEVFNASEDTIYSNMQRALEHCYCHRGKEHLDRLITVSKRINPISFLCAVQAGYTARERNQVS